MAGPTGPFPGPRDAEATLPMTRTCQDRPYGHGPVALLDCELHGPGSGAELFVVEGESAALAVARVRDPRFQAVLPMQGKPLNAIKATPRRVAAQPLFAALATALGTRLGEPPGAAPPRFERLLILTDPDADGIHCGVLLLAFIHRFLPSLLDAPPSAAPSQGGGGMVEWVRAPWGVVVPEDGTPPVVAHSEEGLVELAARVRRERAASLRRFRGLAAIDTALLLRHCVDRASRRADRIDARRVAGMLALLAPGWGAADGGAG